MHNKYVKTTNTLKYSTMKLQAYNLRITIKCTIIITVTSQLFLALQNKPFHIILQSNWQY